MAYVNVAEWKTNQVCEWLKGLDNSVLPYVHSFMNHNVNGQQLLNLRPEDLEHLCVFKLGHQEIILEAVEYLRTFHYELDRENLQLLALRLSGQAHSLYNELSRQTDLSKPVTTQALSDVVAIIKAVKPLIRWLDRPPFSGHLEYNEKKAELLKLSLEMATCAQRDRFAEKPIEEIKTTCGQLAKLADYIIQDIADPMILQPASLDLATLKKKPGDDLGFCILPSFHGAHQVAEIKFGSAAHQCGKMEEGDEIVQVNYQTVVGWERKNVLELFRESPADVLLTLKRRPRHTKVYGQIYIKPYRLPSNKKTPYSMRWEHNLPSPRPELLTIPDFVMPLPKHTKKTATPKSSLLDTVSMLDTMTTDDSGSSSAGDDSDDGIEPRSAVRLYAAKPRNLVQRRATITGASPTAKHSRVNLEQFWRELKREHSTLSFQLRDKAASCAQGLNNVNATQQQQHHQSAPAPTSRSQTSMGVEQRTSEGRKVKFQDSGDRSPLANGGPTSGSDRQHDANDSCNSNNSSHTSDETCESNNKTSNNKASKESLLQPKSCDSSKDNNEPPALPARVSPTATKERGRLDKSFSTPAYDLTESDDDFIERKFEAALDEHHKQQLKARAASGKNKTDSRLFDSVEDLEEHDRTTASKSNLKDANFDTSTIIGNVARKINDIEKNLHSRSTEHLSEKNSAKSSTTTSPIKANTNVHIKINDVDVNDNLDDLEADSGNITTDFDSDEESNFLSSDTCDTKSEATKPVASNESTADNSAELSRESSEDKSESTGSYMEANTSGSTDSSADVDVKKLPVDADFIAKQDDMVSGQNDGMIEALAPNTQLHKNAFVENISAKYPTSPVLSSPGSSLSRPNTPKRDVTKPEVKPRLTPPEPPPRKYFAKPAPLNFNVGQEQAPGNLSPRDHQEKPRVPERPSVRQELKKPDVVPEALPRNDNVPKVQPRSENVLVETHRRKNERLETYSDFVEKSTDFIDEPNMSMQHEPNKTSNSFMDPYGYTEIPDDQEPTPRDKPLSPVIVTSHATVEHSRPKDHPVSQNIDAADGLCYSRQTQATPVENKPRSLEKDKSYERGMINRAMMVARSMGLHGNSAKASNSPRSVRKQTTNIAKRRNVAVKDITPGDLEGYLIYRSRGAGGAWNKAWFILKGSSLYRFKAQDSTKADCLIALSGFTAAQATEVKSRKYAFKVYYTGTVFYFAVDTEDTLALWLETINRVTLRAERTSGLFSETDESDGENKSKTESSGAESKPLAEKTFNSLKKLGKKDTSVKDHELNGASLDRKYLKFLGSRTQNVPVPTAQFRSYRRVLPTSTPHRKPEKMSSPDLQVTIAGSTFYGLNSSQSATDVLSSSHDMGDYRRTTERLRSNRNQRPEEFQGFMTLEEFMLSRQEEECQRSMGNSFNSTSNNNTSPARFHTPLNNDHVHLQHSNASEGFTTSSTNGMIYGSPRNIEDASVIPTEQAPPTPTRSDLVASSNHSFDGSETSSGRSDSLKSKGHKKSWEPSCLQKKKPSTNNNYEGHRPYSPTPAQREVVHSQMNTVSDNRIGYNTLDYGERLKPQAWYRTVDACNANVDFPQASRRPLRNDGYLSSSSDLACQACAETTLQRTRKEAALGRNGSFNMADRRRPDRSLSEEDWSLETARYDEHMRAGDNRRGQSNNIQHQPPIVAPSMSLHQGVMRPAFEMHFDQQLQQPASPKKKGLRNLFGKSSPKSSRSDPSREQTQKKTLLGSPSLRRAFFRDKTRNRSTNHNATENEIGQSSYIVTSQNSNFYPNYNSMNQTVNNVEMPPIFHPSRYPMDEAFPHYHNNPNPIPQWPSPPPPNTGPGILPSDYPPIFEPETYTFSNPSLRRQRSTKNNEDRETRQ